MNEDKFSGKADYYDKYRPSYPSELIDWLYSMTNAAAVADIGAGTGKFTEKLLEKPWQVTAVEPNPDMLSILRRNFPNLTTVQASAEDTGIPAGSVGLVTVAQAFHWFDEEMFREECKRLLTAGGRLAIVFNSRSTEGISAERDRLCERYCPAFANRNGHVGKRSAEEGDAFLRNEYFSKVDVFNMDNPVIMTREHFIGDTLSRSYSLKQGDEGYTSFVEELSGIFDKYQQNGLVSVCYTTTCYAGQF